MNTIDKMLYYVGVSGTPLAFLEEKYKSETKNEFGKATVSLNSMI